MNYEELGAMLEKLGRKIKHHADAMQGDSLARDAVKLRDVARKFEGKLEEVAAGQIPGMTILEDLMSSPQAKKHLDAKICQKVWRQLGTGRLESEQPAAARRELLKTIKACIVHDDSLAESAVEIIRSIFKEGAAAAEGPVPEDKVELQNELLRMGELDDEAFAVELKKRYRTVGSLRTLAMANMVQVKRGEDWIARETLAKNLRQLAVRAAENVRHRAE